MNGNEKYIQNERIHKYYEICIIEKINNKNKQVGLGTRYKSIMESYCLRSLKKKYYVFIFLATLKVKQYPNMVNGITIRMKESASKMNFGANTPHIIK